MPSDPTGVSPKGVLSRPAADFFDDHLASVYSSDSTPFVSGKNIWRTSALFNNALGGMVFKVWGISVSNTSGFGLGFFFAYGQVGTFAANAQPLRPDVAAPYGQVFTNVVQNTAQANPLITNPIVGHLGTNGFDSTIVTSPFPLFIVPVGYSLVAANLQEDTGFTTGIDQALTIWYQVAND